MDRKPFHVQEESDGGVMTTASLRALNAKLNKLLWAIAILAICTVALLGISIYAAATASSAQSDVNNLTSGSQPTTSTSNIMFSSSPEPPNGYSFMAPLFQASGYWAEAPNLPVAALTDHQVVSNGTSAFLIGGAIPANNTDGQVVDTLYEFDSLLGTFTPRASMPSPRYRHAAALLDGKIYVVGGFNASDDTTPQTLLPGTLVYDIAGDKWTSLDPERSSPVILRSDACSYAVAGKLYLAGGWDQDYTTTLNSVEVFDPETEKWSELESPMPTPRGDAACAALHDSFFIVAGGYYDPTNNWTPGAFLTTVEAYHPANASWTTLAPMLHARGDKALTVLPAVRAGTDTPATGERLMVLGGETTADGQDEVASNKVSVYFPEENTWAASSPMPFGRFRFGAAYLQDIGVYVFGGATTSVCNAQGECEKRGGAETVLKFLNVEEKTDVYLFVKDE